MYLYTYIYYIYIYVFRPIFAIMYNMLFVNYVYIIYNIHFIRQINQLIRHANSQIKSEPAKGIHKNLITITDIVNF